MSDPDCKDCDDSIGGTDEHYSVLLEKVREGKRLPRRDRTDLNTWLLLRCADYLNEVGSLLRAPNEIPLEVEVTGD